MPTVKTGDVKKMITAFEKVLQKAEDPAGRVDVATLKAEVQSVTTDKKLKAALEKSIDTLEDRFTRTSSASCGSTTRSPPKTLSAREVKSVFAALLEAKTKGLENIDKNSDGKVTARESHGATSSTLGEELAEAAAEAATGKPAAPRPRPSPAPTGGGTSAGCGGSGGSVGGGGSGRVGC